MIALFSAIFLFAILGLLVLFISWGVHISMVRDECKTYGWAGFKDFINQFGKADWNKMTFNESGLMGSTHDDYYHSGIIRFNGNGMIIRDPISYMFVNLFVWDYIRRNYKNKRVINKWR